MARLGEGGRDQAVAQASVVAGQLAGIRRALGLATLEPRALRLDSVRLRELIAVTQSVQALCMRLLIDAPEPDEALAARLEVMAHAVRNDEPGSVAQVNQLMEGQ